MKSPNRWTLLVVFALVAGSLVVLSGSAIAGARCNSVGQSDVTLTSASTATSHTFTVMNGGPACVVDVKLSPISLKSSNGEPLRYFGVTASSSPTWRCTQDLDPADDSILVECSLGAAIPAGKSAFLTIGVERTRTTLFHAKVEIPGNTSDPVLSDNVVWGSFGTRASSADFPNSSTEVKNQNVVVDRPPQASISINQLLLDSGLAETPAPCAATNVCLTSGQVTVTTPSLVGIGVTSFLASSDSRITTVITVDTVQDLRARLPQVYRFVDFGSNPPNDWVPLPNCSPAVDPAVGCVASISISTDLNTLGHLRIELWTTHNGHYQ
jgi:hypothetical protein